jgi:P-type Ca2+ transporter type 2C
METFAEYALSHNDAAKRLTLEGENIIVRGKKTSLWKVLFRQLLSPLVYVLVIAAGVSIIVGHFLDATVILIVVLGNTLLGFFQEIKADRSLSALSRMVSQRVKVARSGEIKEVDAREIVCGDIVFFSEGSKISADGVMIDGFRVLVDESILTGEAVPVSKNSSIPKHGYDWNEVDGRSLLYMGTVVIGGRGAMKVVRTGGDTEIGKIATSLEGKTEEITPLQSRLKALSSQLVVVILALSVGIFVVGVILGRDILSMLLTSLALSVSAIPEGLLVALTVILTVGMQRILKRKALVRKLVAAETLGTVTTVCVDKTGTLTEGKMRVIGSKLVDEGSAIKAIVMANGLVDPLEVAMWEWIKTLDHVDPQRIFDERGRIDVIPFLPKERFQLSLDKEGMIWFSGAPEILLSKSNLKHNDKASWIRKVEQSAQKGNRLVGFASRKAPSGTEKLDVKLADKLTWLGFLEFEDPIRPEVPAMVEEAIGAGISIKVITGDYRLTAEKIIFKAGIIISNPDREIMEGKELAELPESELVSRVCQVKLFARVSPDQKYRIVEALKKNGEVVAMMGDGVNDAPALKAAHVGIVLSNASDVSRETADMVLLDSNFKTILSAIEEGRVMFDNLRKVVMYLVCDSFQEILFVVLALILGWPIPLTAVQILWINLISDGFPSLALTIDIKRKGIMEAGPISSTEPILNKSMKSIVAVVSSLGGVSATLVFAWQYLVKGDLMGAQSLSFALIGVNSLLYVFSCRNIDKPIWRDNLLSNKWLLVAVAVGFVLMFVPFSGPYANTIFGVRSLRIHEWSLLIFVGFGVLGVIESAKFLRIAYGRKV